MGAKKCISKFLGVLNSFGGKFRCCEKNCDGFFAALKVSENIEISNLPAAISSKVVIILHLKLCKKHVCQPRGSPAETRTRRSQGPTKYMERHCVFLFFCFSEQRAKCKKACVSGGWLRSTSEAVVCCNLDVLFYLQRSNSRR